MFFLPLQKQPIVDTQSRHPVMYVELTIVDTFLLRGMFQFSAADVALLTMRTILHGQTRLDRNIGRS